MSSADRTKIMQMFKLWQSAYIAKKALDFKIYASRLSEAKKGIAELSQIKDPYNLIGAMRDFKYVADPTVSTKAGKIQLDIPTHPQITYLTKRGDCEDYALLVEAIRKGGILVDFISIIKGGYRGHIVYWDKEYYVFSAVSAKKHLTCDGQFDSLDDMFDKYGGDYAVYFDSNINVKQIIEQLTLPYINIKKSHL